MTDARSRLFQVRLSDALLIAIVPAASAMVIQALHLVYLPPQHLYIIAAVSVLPGAFVGLLMAQQQRSEVRIYSVALLSLSTVTLGMAIVPAKLQELRNKRMAENQTAVWTACTRFAEAE